MRKLTPQKRLCVLIIASVFLINIGSFLFVKLNSIQAPDYIRDPPVYGSVPIYHNEDTENLGYIDDDNISLYWFVHITDPHVSASNPAYLNTLGEFLNWTYDYMHPFTIILTGDVQTGQDERELTLDGRVENDFKAYFETVNKTPYATDENWYRYIETAGNHDRNCDYNLTYWMNYTITGQRFGTVQQFFKANFTFGDSIFNILDSTPFTSPPKYYGSEGQLDSDDLHEFYNFIESNKEAEHKMVFMHHHPLLAYGLAKSSSSWFPTSIVTYSQQSGVDCIFYGHTHMQFYETFGDVVYLMGDRWRDSYYNSETMETTAQYYNLVAVDGGNMNFAFTPYSKLPNVIITNPGSPVFLDEKDSITSTRGDGHIRVLVFPAASDPIVSVKYKIDGGTWIPMNPYQGSQVLYESDRGTMLDPQTAIPDDGQDHVILVRVTTNNGIIITQQAISTSRPERKMWWEWIVIAAVATIGAIIIIQNRDNYPLKRCSIGLDGKKTYSRRRLTHREKVDKRISYNQKNNKPWQLSYLLGAVFLSIIAVPWSILPLFHFAPGVGFTLFTYSSNAIYFFFEPLVYTAGRILVILPVLYYNVRIYRADAVNFAGFLLFGNAMFLLIFSFMGFGTQGLILPGIYFDLVVSIAIMTINFKNTYLGKYIIEKKSRKKI